MEKNDKYSNEANCIFFDFETYKKFCEQINRVDLIYVKRIPSLSFKELKEKMNTKDKLENFYE